MDSSTIRIGAEDDVHLGFWTNWSYGRIRGATLTLTQRDGGFLTAFLAVFVILVGTCFWRLACFVLHYWLSSRTAKDALYHQRQAILRNAASGSSGFTSLLQMSLAWQGDPRARPFWRLLPLTTFAFFTLALFTFAGIFSSKVSTSMGHDVLLRGRNCGLQSLDGLDAITYFSYLPYFTQRTRSSADYATRCYRDGADAQECPPFIQQRLPWTSSSEAECPFPGGDKICRRKSTNLRLDSGYIHSQLHLGINLPPEHQFLYRLVIQCAPLKSEGYSQTVTTYHPRNETRPLRRVQYYYGDDFGNLGPKVSYQTSAQVSAAAEPEDWNLTRATRYLDYTLGATWAQRYPNGSLHPSSLFRPIPDVLPPNADVVLLFLSANDIIFSKPTDDEWYSARTPTTKRRVQFSENLPGDQSFYVRDDPARVLGCTSQYQFCNPNAEPGSDCTPLDGVFYAMSAAQRLWPSERQKATFNWSAGAIISISSSLSNLVATVGLSALTSRYSLSLGMQGPLLSNQWQLDATFWFRSILADLQRTIVEVATGPMDRNLDRFLVRPKSDGERLVCQSQKIQSNAFTSFSTLGLALLLGLGGLIIGACYVLEPLAVALSRWTKFGTYQRLEWTANGTLQLQRLAHEQAGYGTWSRTAGPCPVTAPGEILATVDTFKPDHPKLQSCPNSFGSSSEQEYHSPSIPIERMQHGLGSPREDRLHQEVITPGKLE